MAGDLGGLFAKLFARRIANRYKEGKKWIEETIPHLSPSQQKIFHERFEARKKSVMVGYMFWTFTAHYVYVKRWVTQFFFWITLGGLFMWWFLDMCLMFFIVERYNHELAQEIVAELLEEGSVKEPDALKHHRNTVSSASPPM